MPHKPNRSLECPLEIPGLRVHGPHRRDPDLAERVSTRTASGHPHGPERTGFDPGSRARSGWCRERKSPASKRGFLPGPRFFL